MSKSSSPIILLLTMLLAACQSVPEPVIEAQQPEVATTAVIDSPPSAQSEPEAEVEAEPIDPNQHTYEEAIAALKDGDTEGALVLLMRLSGEAPDKPRLFTNLGLAYFSLQQADLAEQAFQQAVTRDPDDAVAYNHLGILQRLNGRFQEALVQYQRAIEIDDSYAPAYLNLGILFDLYLQDLEKALQQYQKYQLLSSEDNPQVGGWIVDIERRLKKADSQSQG
ncbi:MAG: tetratricopeptide repeat protein [Gammaproteobacteria bacterium]|nr:tetratricopeptide repeat protein [Gammaproteobacteria bacterium]